MKRKLKDLCLGYTKNIAQKELDDLNGDYEIYGASGLIKKIDYYISEVPYIGIVKDGSGVGRVNSYPAKSSLIGTMQYIVPNKDIHLQFLMYGLRSLNLGNLYRGAAIPHIYFKEYKEFELNVPSKEDQQKIAAELDTIQSAIDNKKQQLSLLDEAVKSEFVEMFGENPIENGKWKVEELGKICSKISDGVHAKPEYQEDGMPFISVVNMNTGNLSFEDCKFVSFEAYEKMIKSTNPEKGDVLYTKVGATYGISALVDTDRKFCLYVSVALLKPMHDLIDSVFLAKTMMMPYVKHQADNSLKGIGVPDLHLNQIRSFKIAVPPLELQNKFAAFVQQIDKSKIVVKQQIFDLQELLDSKMQEYFGE